MKTEEIRIEVDHTRTPVPVDLAFHNCRLKAAYGRTGLTQDEDHVPLPLENDVRRVIPGFFWCHYWSFLGVLDCGQDARVHVKATDASFDVDVSALKEGPRTLGLTGNTLLVSSDDAGTDGAVSIDPATVRAGDSCVFHIRYTVGKKGVPAGGGIRIVSPFSCWSDPVISTDSIRLFTRTRAGLVWSVRPHHWAGRGPLLTIQVRDGGLEEGDVIDLRYASGTEGVRVQPYAENAVFFKVMVDLKGNGDFHSFSDAQIPPIRVVNNRPRRIRLACPMTVRRGETFTLTALVMDDFYNPVFDEYAGTLKVFLNDRPLREAELPKKHMGKCFMDGITIDSPGLNILRVQGPDLADAFLCVDVSEDEPETRLFWGQIHGHSRVSDGAGTAEEYFAYGRDIGLLDVCALTDHEWEILEHYRNTVRGAFRAICECANRYNATGKYVTFPAYEWMTDGAHINVYYLDDDTNHRVVPSGVSMTGVSKGSGDVTAFLSYYRGSNVVLIPHASHGFDWSVFDPDLMPVLEMHSMWGTSEFRCHGPGAADGLNSGHKVGFIGGSDGHHGRPGQTGRLSRYRILNCREGLAAFYAPMLTRQAVGSALRRRRVYATTGERIFLDFRINGDAMGSEIAVRKDRSLQVLARIGGTGRIANIELLRNCEVIDVRAGRGIVEAYENLLRPEEVNDGDWFYLRVTQEDGEKAWSSPIWVKGK